MADQNEDENLENAAEDAGPELICICDDAFREGECPVHPSEQPEGYPTPPTPEIFVVTAAMRYEPTKKTQWIGYGFICPNCQENSLRHWETGGYAYCPACGAKIAYEFENK